MPLRSTDWLKQSVGLLRKKAVVVQTVAAASPSHATTKASDLRSTFVRLNSKKALPQEALKPKALAALLAQLRDVVYPTYSEVEGGQKAHAVARWYHSATALERRDCWQLMSEQFGIDTTQLDNAMRLLSDTASTPTTQSADVMWLQEAQLRKGLRCVRTQLIRRFAVFADGMRFLVSMRAELLQYLNKHPQDKAMFAALDSELETLFATWFDVAFLELTRISWNSPAALIEKLIQYEAVHDIQSWDDVKNRLDSDRRCYGFFHPRLPGEPLIFVEVAFTHDMADSMAPILDDRAASTDLSKAKTANFYSISNTQPGLKGVGFGDSLIKKVVHALQQELPQIKTYTTLSPVPSFKPWLQLHASALLEITPNKLHHALQQEYAQGGKLQAAHVLNALEKFTAHIANDHSLATQVSEGLQKLNGVATSKKTNIKTPSDLLLEGNNPNNAKQLQPKASAALKQWLMGAVAHYLSNEKMRGYPVDPVAKFHLGNGATLARLNWAADTSAKGMQQSYGVMVNYLYDLKRLDKNRQDLQHKGAIAVLPAVHSLSL